MALHEPVLYVWDCFVCESYRSNELCSCFQCGRSYHQGVCGGRPSVTVDYHPIDPDDLIRGQFGGHRSERVDMSTAKCSVCKGILPEDREKRIEILAPRTLHTEEQMRIQDEELRQRIAQDVERNRIQEDWDEAERKRQKEQDHRTEEQLRAATSELSAALVAEQSSKCERDAIVSERDRLKHAWQKAQDEWTKAAADWISTKREEQHLTDVLTRAELEFHRAIQARDRAAVERDSRTEALRQIEIRGRKAAAQRLDYEQKLLLVEDRSLRANKAIALAEDDVCRAKDRLDSGQPRR